MANGVVVSHTGITEDGRFSREDIHPSGATWRVAPYGDLSVLGSDLETLVATYPRGNWQSVYNDHGTPVEVRDAHGKLWTMQRAS